MPGTKEERIKDYEEGFNEGFYRGWTHLQAMNAKGQDFTAGFKLARRYYQEGMVPPYPKDSVAKAHALKDNKEEDQVYRHWKDHFRKQHSKGKEKKIDEEEAEKAKQSKETKKVTSKEK